MPTSPFTAKENKVMEGFPGTKIELKRRKK